MTEYRRNPATGRLAERMPDSVDRADGFDWLYWSRDYGLTVQLMTDADVADWPVVAVPPSET